MLQVQTNLTAPWKAARVPPCFAEASYYLGIMLNTKVRRLHFSTSYTRQSLKKRLVWEMWNVGMT